MGQNVWGMSPLEILIIVVYSFDTTDMLLKEIGQDLKILKITWLSAQLAKSLMQVTECHFHECLLELHPSTIPDCP